MDHKIEVKKKSKLGCCLIVFLVIVLLAAGAAFFLMKTLQKTQLETAQKSLEKLTVTTTKIKEGPFEVKLSNITGTIRAEQSVDLNWQTSGIVEEVLVGIGDTVERDQVLAYLSEESLDQDVLNARVDIRDARDDYDELVNNTQQVSTALSTLVTARKTLEDAQEKLDSMDMSRVTDTQLIIARESAALASKNYDRAVGKFEEVRDAPADSEARKKAFGDLAGYRSVRDNALAEYNSYMGQIDMLELQMREAAVELAKAELEEAEYQYNKVVAGPSEAELNRAQSKIDSYQKTIDSSKIIAPMSGRITKIDAKVGDVITYGSDMATRNIFALRIDKDDTYYIDFTVSELYINDIHEGQEVDISLPAIPDKTYHGVVTNVSDVGDTSGWNVTFKVTVAFTDADANIKSGMTADISMEAASVDNALYVPQSSVIVKDGRYYVNFKRDNGDMDEVEVQIGLISGTSVQIISDFLRGGDEIELDVNGDEESGFGFFMPGMGGMLISMPTY